jgi:hypothetical protein
MLLRLFPKTIDNRLAGHPGALWLLIPVLILKTLMGFNVAGLNPFTSSRNILISADGVPLDSYGAEAASHMVFMFAAWGLALLTICLFGWIALIRYRAMIPLACLMLAIEQIGRKGLAHLHPTVTSGAAEDGLSPAFWINAGLSSALALAFALSLWPRRTASA